MARRLSGLFVAEGSSDAPLADIVELLFLRRGRPVDLSRPDFERLADPKALLAECILTAASVTGRRRDRLAKRFNQNRRLLLERLDPDGPVVSLEGWTILSECVTRVVACLDESASG